MDKSIFKKEYKILRKLLLDIRKEKNIKQEHLAEFLDKPQSFISKYESGERRLDFVELLYVLKGLDVDPPSFFKKFQSRIK